MTRAQDPCERDSDELTGEHVRALARALRTAATRLSRELLRRANATSDLAALVELADLGGSALAQIDRVAADLPRRAPEDASA